MKICALLCACLSLLAQDYTPGPDSRKQSGVPEGKLTQHTWTSRIFPGTVRDYWVYLPAQYNALKPAPVMIFQDGGGFVGEKSVFQAPTVLDNLIHKREIPVMIGIFVNPGVLPALSGNQQARYNRSFEYDALGDRYARFLLEELIPEVGRSYALSNDPNDRGLAGSSSGAIAAFTAAWERPDAFRRVLSFIGSYTNLRGGHSYSSLIRKTEPKPLRVYLQDGKADQNIYGGNWWIGNQDMASALEYAGYDSTFVIGTEGHNGKHGSAILPDALRWLWRDYPKPITTAEKISERHEVRLILDPAAEWQQVSEGHQLTEGPAIDRDGNIFFTDIRASRIHKITPEGKVSVFKEDTGSANGMMFGPDGKLYVCQNGKKRILAYAKDGTEEVIAEGVNSNDLTINRKGEIYFTEPPTKRVWLIDAARNKRVVHEGIDYPNGVLLSADQSLLYVTDYRGKWVWSFQVQSDGSLVNGQPFYRMETPDDSGMSAADGLAVDTEGYLYVATRLGLQVCDQAGRVVAILNKPHTGPLTNSVFGGPDLQTLYVTHGDKVFKRHLRRKGVLPWQPATPPRPRL